MFAFGPAIEVAIKWDSILVSPSLTLDVELAVCAVGHITKTK
jgi:hypothetical protein